MLLHYCEQEERKELDMIVLCINGKALIKVDDHLQHPSQVERRVGIDVKLGLEKLKESFRHTFGEDINNL